MPISVEDLPELTSQHYSITEAITGRPVPPEPLEVTRLEVTDDNRIILIPPVRGRPLLHSLQLLSKASTMESYRSRKDRRTTAKNIGHVARIGGFAALQVHQIAQDRGGLPEEFMAQLHNSLKAVNLRMREAYEPLARPVESDREAVFFMHAIYRKLDPSR